MALPKVTLPFLLKAAGGFCGVLATILGLWWAITSQIESIIDRKNHEMLVTFESKLGSLDGKIQDNTAVVIGVMADDFRDRLILVEYEIQGYEKVGRQVPFDLYTRKKQLEENLEDIKKWQD